MFKNLTVFNAVPPQYIDYFCGRPLLPIISLELISLFQTEMNGIPNIFIDNNNFCNGI